MTSLRFSSLLAIAAAFLFVSTGVAAEMTMSVEQLRTFIQSSISLKQPDRQVAEYLHHVKLTHKLDDRTIEELQGLGAGPKTVAVLHDLRDTTSSLPAAPPPPPEQPKPAPIPGPNSIEQGKILDEVREYALNYTKQLPNFICVQVTRRYIDQRGADQWRLVDTVTTRLSYFENHEDYKVILVNNRSVENMSMEQLGGTTSAGEFGSMMRDIFSPESAARFEWDHWATLRGKRAYVFSYDIDQAHSRYHMIAERTLELVPAYRGLLYIDRDNGTIMRITLVPYDIPATYPVHEVKTVLDYDLSKVGDTDFMLPLKAVLTSRLSNYTSKNDVEFRLYRKFGTETTIKFETPEALPEDKPTEQSPPKAPLNAPAVSKPKAPPAVDDRPPE